MDLSFLLRTSIYYGFESPILEAIVTLVCGTMSLVVGIKFLRNWHSLKKNGIRATGEVVGLEMFISDDGTAMYHPIIKFTTMQNEIVTAKYDIATSAWYKIGDQVKILYDPSAVKKFIIDNNVPLFLAVLFMVIGIAAYSFLIITFLKDII